MVVWVLLLLAAVAESLSEVLKMRVDVDFPGDDVLQIYSPDIHHCQLACTQHHSCRFFTFLRPDWDKDDRKFYCFLKYTDSGIPSQVSELNGATSGFSLSDQECKTCSCLPSVYQDVDFPGSDYRKLPTSSYDVCQKVCTRDPDCRFFSFTTENFPAAAYRKICYLKYSWPVPIPPSITTQTGLVSGFSQSLPKDKGTIKEECKVEILANTEFPGNDFEQVPAGSPQHCQFLCSLHPRCTHFSFSQSKTWHHMSCFLKYKPDVSKDESVGKGEVYSGFPTRNCKPSNVWGRRFEDIDFYGADSSHAFVDNADLCEDKCTADPRCQFYTYVLPSYPNLTPELRNKCHLKQVMTLPRPARVISAKGVISGFSLKSCKDASSAELRVDVDFPGDDVLQIYSPDVHHCQLACTEHHSCRFFTFLRPDWDKDDRKFYCYLKHTASGNPSRVTELKGVTSGFALSHQEYKTFLKFYCFLKYTDSGIPSQVSELNGATSGFSLSDQECKTCSCLPSVYQDVDFPGSDYRKLPTSSYDVCQKVCTRDPDCRFFSFTTENFPAAAYRKICYLKYSWPVPIPPSITTQTGLVSGFSQSLPKAKGTIKEECKVEILANTEFPGNDFEQVPAGSPQHCQFLCSLHPRCTHFSFSQSKTWHHMSCFLKYKPDVSKDESVGKGEVYSGFPTRNCKPSNVWGRRFEDIDFYGADSSHAFVDNADLCEDKCTADPRCQFYTYVLPSYPNLTPELRNKCHLKQVMTLPRPARVISAKGVISGFSLKSCKDASSAELRVDVDFPGDDVLQIYSPDVHHCQLACTEHHSCRFFTFLRPDWDKDDRKFYCYLKHTASGNPSRVTELKGVTSGFALSHQEYKTFLKFYCFLKYTDSGIPSQVSELNGATSGFSLSDQECKTCSCLPSVYQDVDFPGSDYRKLPTSSYDVCQKVCTRDPDCRFFSFTTENFPAAAYRKICYLKYSWPVPIPPSITTQTGLVSGFSQSLPKAKGTIKEECKVEILANTEFPGNDFEQVPAGSPQHCQFLCSLHPRCTHFSFSQSKTWHHMSCFLKYKPDVSKDESVGKGEVYSGFPTRNCKPSNVWGRRFEDIDFYGADSSHAFVDNADLCEDKCTADPRCQFYTYVLPSYPNLTPELRNKCHLKQVMTLPRPARVISAKGVISGFSLKSCKDASSAELRVDVDFPGDDVLQIYSPDVHHCQLACTEHHSCRFFTFLRPDWDKDDRKFYCYLKHTASGNPSRVTELKGVTSGFALSHQEYKTLSCLPSIYQDVDFPGSDYRNLPSSSYEECQEVCTSDPDCRFFSFTTENFPAAEYRKMCFLKYSWSVPVPPVITTKRGLVSGFSQSLQKAKETSREECKVEILANAEFPGNDFEQVPAGSSLHCQILCSIHPRCTHFSFSQSKTWHHMSCFLKYKQDVSKDESVGKEEVYSGFPTRNCKPSNVWGRRFEDIDFYGADSSHAFVDNADLCEDKCTADPRCQFYTYVLPSYPNLTPELRNKCHLKRVMTLPRPAKVVSARGVVSGFSLKSCGD